MGAWIEIPEELKDVVRTYVAPLVGAWIEITSMTGFAMILLVAPLVGAWIEIERVFELFENMKSLPLWERGLK